MAEYGEKAALAAMRGCVKRNQTVLASDAEIVLAMIDRQQSLQDVAAEYLKANGWEPLVMGAVAIKQPLLGNKLNYELTISFTGKRLVTDK
jgi:hypothetical protein